MKPLLDGFTTKITRFVRGFMCPSGLDLCSSQLLSLAARLLEHRHAIGSRWCRLNAGRQALLAFAHLRHGPPYAHLAAGFGIGTMTAHWYITEAVEFLAALAPSLTEAVRTESSKAAVLLDGTQMSTDQTAAYRSFYSGRHKKHSKKVQILTDLVGRLLRASPALPSAIHDVRAAREHGVIDALAEAGIKCWVDKGYQEAGGTVRVPCRGRWEVLAGGPGRGRWAALLTCRSRLRRRLRHVNDTEL